ncbi:MAG TPA: sigma-70 family RNA polymerase sigma factor [Anaerolineales bacterium]|nr:sigma-70 family RNA polymerase sigma factor [Anaerolineales bacterium]
MDESVLIRSAQGGDLEAFNTLVLAYQDMLFSTALRILGDDELAADATQDAFISAFRGINSYRGGSFKAWLLRTVTNTCYDELRRRKRRPTTPLEPDASDGDELDAPRWLADPALTPEQSAEALELEHAIQHCLNNLPLEFRTVVVMADLQGLDYTEVAVAVRAPLGTIKSRLARARLRLRECLQGFRELLPSAFRLEGELAE